VPVFKTWKFKNPQLEAQMATFSRMVKSHGHDNAIVTISKGWKNILENLQDVEDLAKRAFNNEIAGGGLTYMKANVLQFVEALAFVSKFSRKFLNYAYVCETAEIDSNTSVAESLTPAELDWLAVNLLSFCQAFNIVAGNPVVVRKQMADIPDINITPENIDTVGEAVGHAKIDPFRMSLIPIWMNPVYHIGMAVAEYQASRFKAAKEELRLVELRKLNLEKLSAGTPDAQVQKEINYLESRIQGLNFKISKMEERAHGPSH
jgi:hypothetical protein